MLGYMLARQHIQKVQQLSQQEQNQSKGFVYAHNQYMYIQCVLFEDGKKSDEFMDGGDDSLISDQIRWKSFKKKKINKKIKTFFFFSPFSIPFGVFSP